MVTVDLDTAPVRRRRTIDWGQPFVYFVALAVAGTAVSPVLYVIISGFRTTKQLNENLAGWPDPWTFATYGRVLFGSDTLFWSQAFTSAVIAAGTTAGVVVFGVMAAYVIARYQFTGRALLYSVFTAGLLFPVSVAILPLSILLRTFGLNGSFMGVIIPQIAFALPTTVIILVPFLRAIPQELEDAAMIDGTSRVGFFWRILLPLSTPGLVTVGVLAFVGSWNSYLLPLFVLGAGGTDPSGYTLPLGVQQFSTQYSADTAGVLAFTSLAMIPALVFFLFAERRIVGGLTGAVKG